MKQYMAFLCVGKKDAKSRKGSDVQNLHRKKKRSGRVMQRKQKKESKLLENFPDELYLKSRNILI
jgi:hypothetical protein